MTKSKFILFASTLVFSAVFALSCGGGSSKPSKSVKKEKISGVSQKGPFVAGSKVIIYELNSDYEKTGKSFKSTTIDDKGTFEIKEKKKLQFSTQYALLEVTGKYMNEITGEISKDDITLYAISDIKDRESFSVNVLTHLEYLRVLKLLNSKTMKVDFDQAKKIAQEEVLNEFGIEGDGFKSSEDMSIFGSETSDAALLAVSIILLNNQTEEKVANLLENFSKVLEENGKIGNDLKVELSNSIANLDFESVKKNLTSIDTSARISNFQDMVVNYEQSIKVRIGRQTWMVRNMNLSKDSQGNDIGKCYDNNPANCDKFGRLYTYDEAKNVCPKGWHLPDSSEWESLIRTVETESKCTYCAGKWLKAQDVWLGEPGSNDFGFMALPGGGVYPNGDFGLLGQIGLWWSATSNGTDDAFNYVMFYNYEGIKQSYNQKDYLLSVRCMED